VSSQSTKREDPFTGGAHEDKALLRGLWRTIEGPDGIFGQAQWP
jgi:hypothetical protein